MYRSLDAGLIVETCRSTQERITGRFSHSGLSKVAAELLIVCESAATLASWLAKPHRPLRALAGVAIAAILFIVAGVAMHVKLQPTFSSSIAELLQGLDAAINEVVFVSVAAFFFLTIENLTNGLSRKIWQKIMIFDRILAPGTPPPSQRPIL